MGNIQRFFSLLLVLAATQVKAFDYWTVNLTPQALKGSYSGSPIRDELSSEGALLNLQYLERGALVLGYFPLQLHYKRNIPSLNQLTYYASARDFLTPDFLKGWLTLRLDSYTVSNNDPTHETDDVNIIQPIVSYVNYAKTYALDIGYAESRYGRSKIGNSGLHVSQFTPTFGKGFNKDKNWLRFRLYDIHASNYARAQHQTHSDGVEITLSQYILYYPAYIPNKIDLDVFLGRRTYAVDSDAVVVYNLGDIQRNSVSVQVNWRLNSHLDFLLSAGHYNFTSLIFNTRYPYSMNYVFAGLTMTA